MTNLISKLTFGISLCCLVVLFSAYNYGGSKQWKPNFKPAKNFAEFEALVKNPEANIVRSHADFKAFVQSDERLKMAFKPKVLKAFLSKLKFKDGGVQTFNYLMIKMARPKQYEQILDLVKLGFGWEPTVLGGINYDNYYCEGPGTCSQDNSSICISDNC